MSTALTTRVDINDLQAGDIIVIQDAKKQELRGKVQIKAPTYDSEPEMFIQAFGQKVVFARWLPSKTALDEGSWQSRYKIIKWEAPLPLL
jgi:hypothetical protein